MFLFVTDKAREVIAAAGLWDGLEKLEADASADCLAARLDEIGGAPGFYKRNYRKYRELYRLLEDVLGYPVLILLDVKAQGDEDYRSILYNKQSKAFERLEAVVPEMPTIEAWLAQRLEESKPEPLPAAPEPMYSLWLSPPTRVDDTQKDFWIYDTRLAVADCRLPQFEKHAKDVAELLLNELADPSGVPIQGCGSVRFARQDDFAVIYTVSDSGDMLLMRAYVEEEIPSPGELVDAVLRNWTRAFCERDKSTEELRREAWRAYPVSTLEDAQSWAAVRANAEANIALSSEEEEIIAGVCRDGEGGGLPLFIDGRAGSGKSTMLWHLYARYCDDWLQACSAEHEEMVPPGRPLYVTYNPVLSGGAREGVLGLLANRHEYIARERKLGRRLSEQEQSVLSSTFVTVGDLLLRSLPEAARVDFDVRLRVDYRRFALMFRESFKNRAQAGVSSETAWHVIRTLIKGHYEDRFMEPEDYSEIPRRDKTVSDDDFNTVFDRVWNRWYKLRCHEERLWDDQDLVRAALVSLRASAMDAGRIPAAVFCDEVQDLTRLELSFLMRSSVYPRYSLESYRVSSVPFVFAGDPSQTLNPSGFRWASLTSAFYGDLLFGLGIQARHVQRRTETSLSKNYRSTRPIVELCNSIQLVRMGLFGPRTLRPQESWRVDDVGADTPLKFVLGAVLEHDDVATVAEDTIIIIPCDEGEEHDWAAQDQALSSLIPVEGEAPRNVMSASAAKGLEFEQVILYKFGEQFALHGFDLSPVDDMAVHADLTREYFFNKLYVAASRAKSKLYVVDTQEGDSSFWSRAVAPGFLESLAQSAKDPGDWMDNSDAASDTAAMSEARRRIGYLEVAARDDVGLLAGGDFAAENAEKLFQSGKAQSDPVALRRAWRYFKKLGQEDRASLALAYAFFTAGSFEEAGRQFEQTSEKRMALDCYWEGGHWRAIQDWYAVHAKDAEGDHRLSCAEFMLARPGDGGALRDVLGAIGTLLSGGDISPFSTRWADVVGRLVSDSKKPIEDTYRDELMRVLEELGKRGFAGCTERAAEMHYERGEYRAAVDCWKAAGIAEGDGFFDAQARFEGYPDGLRYARRIKDAEQRARAVTEIWETEHLALRDAGAEWQRALGEAHSSLGNSERALEAFKSCDALDAAADIFWAGLRAGRFVGEKAWSTAVDLAEIALKTKNWPLALELVDGKRVRPLRDRGDARAVGQRFTIVRQIAWSDTDPAGTGIARKDLLDLLREVQTEKDWQAVVSPRVLGLAYERIDDQDSALKYYDDHLQRAMRARDAEREEWARQRWLVVQVRKIRRLEAKGTPTRALNQEKRRFGDYLAPTGMQESQVETLANGDPRKAEILRERAEVSVQTLDGRKRPDVRKDQRGWTEFTFGGFEFLVRPEDHKVVLTDNATREDLIVNLSSRRFSGEAKDEGGFVDGGDSQLLSADRTVRLQIVSESELHVETQAGRLSINVGEAAEFDRS